MNGAATRRSKEGFLVALGAALMLIVLLVLQSLVGSGLLSARTVTVTTTSTDIPMGQVLGSFAEHMLMLQSRNLTAVVSQYEPNASVTWTGNQGPAAVEAPAVGLGNFSRAFDTFLYQPCGFHDTVRSFTVENVTQSTEFNPDGSATVDSTFSFAGNSSLWGEFSGSVSARDAFSYSKTGVFLISQETWNFTQYHDEYPVNPGMVC
ncbi:MAG: hypothetical protein JRN09_09415 [Nitrososphaerota archaeon]|jgi:hypothetical protein|nr:hypothetical protein [Nitrososphaerota archaeon]